MRWLVLLLAVACSRPIEAHDVVPCESGSGQCEYGCRRGADQPTTDAGTCPTQDPSIGGTYCFETFYTDGKDPNRQGCCKRDVGGETIRFLECCEPVETDGGMRYECPE